MSEKETIEDLSRQIKELTALVSELREDKKKEEDETKFVKRNEELVEIYHAAARAHAAVNKGIDNGQGPSLASKIASREVFELVFKYLVKHEGWDKNSIQLGTGDTDHIIARDVSIYDFYKALSRLIKESYDYWLRLKVRELSGKIYPVGLMERPAQIELNKKGE